jgi:hypothetical protein
MFLNGGGGSLNEIDVGGSLTEGRGDLGISRDDLCGDDLDLSRGDLGMSGGDPHGGV